MGSSCTTAINSSLNCVVWTGRIPSFKLCGATWLSSKIVPEKPSTVASDVHFGPYTKCTQTSGVYLVGNDTQRPKSLACHTFVLKAPAHLSHVL